MLFNKGAFGATYMKTHIVRTLINLVVLVNVVLVNIVASSILIAHAAQPDATDLTLSDVEFTELFIRSLAEDQNGALLLSVSESIKVNISPSYMTFTGIIDLEKVAQINQQARQNIERLDSFLFFLDHHRLTLTVIAQPVVRNGLVGVRDNFSIMLGPLPVSNDTLRQLGVPVQNANVTNLKLKEIQIQKIILNQGQLTLSLVNFK